MVTNILNDVKTGLGIDPLNTGFDQELLIHINSEAAGLVQQGVDALDIVILEDTEWPTMLSDKVLSLSKMSLMLGVKLIFDPSASEAITRALYAHYQNVTSRLGHEIDELEAVV